MTTQAVNSTSPDRADELTALLDEIGIDFALHTHHPLTHMEVGDDDTLLKQQRTVACAS